MKKALIFVLSIISTLCFGIGCKDEKEADPGGAASVYTVTFKQDGCEDVTRSVRAGETLTDIPQPKRVEGHTVVWENVDFGAIASNVTVEAIITANSYTIRYHVDDETASVYEQSVVYGAAYTLATPTKDGYIFQKWLIKGTDFAFEEGTYLKAGDTELVPLFTENENDDRFWSGLI